MKPFKFFQKKSERVFTDWMDRLDDYYLGAIRLPLTGQLRAYHRRIVRRYRDEFGLYPGQPNYHAGGLISNQTNHFINEGNITSYNEIRAYYKESYRYLSGDRDIITDEEHQEYVNASDYLIQRR